MMVVKREMQKMHVVSRSSRVVMGPELIGLLSAF